MIYKTNVSQNFEDNKPVYGDTKTSIVTNDNLVVNTDSRYSIDGEIVELQKRHYGTNDASQLLDRSFSELTKTKDGINSANFFNLYRELFFDIPKEGENSHTTLMLESKNYINDYVDPKDIKLNELLERVIELEEEKNKFPTEHPIYKNGTAIKYSLNQGPLGIMQEGRLRYVSNRSPNSQFNQLKRALGFVNPRNGKLLPDEDCITLVSKNTFQSLPKWPIEATIDSDNDNLAATLKDFLEDDTPSELADLVNLGSTIQASNLTREDINILINQLNNKSPFEGYRIEDNFNGTIQWELDELLPFNTKGFAQFETKLFDTVNNQSTQIELEIKSLFDKFFETMNEVNAPPGSADFNFAINNQINISEETIVLSEEENQKYLGILNVFYPAKSELANSLNNLLNDIFTGRFLSYVWTIDPNRSIDNNNNKFYWVPNVLVNAEDPEQEQTINMAPLQNEVNRAINSFLNINDFNYTF